MAGLGGLLAGIGGGVTQAMQNYQQQRDAQMRNMLLNLYLKKQQNESGDESLLGSVLSAGKIPGISNIGGGAPAMPGSPSGMPSGMPAPAPAAPAAMERPTGVMPLEDSPASAGMATERAQALDAPVLDYDVEREAAPPAPAGQPDPGMAPSAPQPAASGGAPAPAAGPGGEAHPAELAAGLAMIQRVDPTAIAQRIKEVKPGVDDAAVWRATASLMKMAQGDRSSQYQAAMIGRLLNYDLGLHRDATAQRGQDIGAQKSQAAITSHEGIAAANRVAAGERQNEAITGRKDVATANQAARGARQDKAIAEQRYQKAAAAAIGQDKLALSEMHRQLADIKRRIDSIDTGPNATSMASKATREGLQKQYDDIAEREKKRAAHILGDGGE